MLWKKQKCDPFSQKGRNCWDFTERKKLSEKAAHEGRTCASTYVSARQEARGMIKQSQEPGG